MTERSITALAPWFGSNRMLARNVGQLMGKRSWIGVPFAGGMCELLHLQARTINANDLHRHIINMARVIAHPKLGPILYRKLRRYVLHTDSVIIAQQRCERREMEMEQSYEKSYDLFGGVGSDLVRSDWAVEPDIQWAEDYFVSCWFSRSHSAGSIDEFSSGMSVRWNSSGGDSARRVQSAIASIPAWRRAIRNVTFLTMDAIAFISKCKDEREHGIYCDPPFPGPGNRYKHRVDESFHRDLARSVSGFIQAKVIMRFYRHPLIEELYPESKWRWHEYRGRTQANKDAPEVLLVNTPGRGEGEE